MIQEDNRPPMTGQRVHLQMARKWGEEIRGYVSEGVDGPIS